MRGLRQPIRLVLAALFVFVVTLSTSQITRDSTATLAVLLITGVIALAWLGRDRASRYYRGYRRRRRGW